MSFEEGKKVDRKIGQNKLHKNQSATQISVSTLPTRQPIFNIVKERLSENQLTRITTYRKPQIKEMSVPCFTIQNKSAINQPRSSHINTNQHTLIEINLKAKICLKKE